MKQIVLHIGMPKTGTSALQVFLARNHAALKEHATDYFQIGEFNLGLKGSISSGNGSFLARTLLPPNSPAWIADGERYHAEFHAAVRASTADVGIVSSEMFIDAARDYLAGRGPFPQRSAVTSVGARFMVDFYDLVDRWAAWATEVAQAWPADPSQAEPTLDIDRYILQLAERRVSHDAVDDIDRGASTPGR